MIGNCLLPFSYKSFVTFSVNFVRLRCKCSNEGHIMLGGLK